MRILHNVLRYAITDRTQFAGDEHARCVALLAQVRRLAFEGVEYLQLREKDMSGSELEALGHQVVAAAQGTSLHVLVNGRLDVAMAIGAAGVHLTAAPGELTPAQVRTLWPAAVVSISCHTLAEVERARDVGADLALYGPVFGKVVGGRPVGMGAGAMGLGLDPLRIVCKAAGKLPVFALGGVTAAHIDDCAKAGAAGIAGIRLFL